MIITDITTFTLRIPFALGTESAATAWGPEGLKAVDSLLVRVTTDQGTVRWGQIMRFPWHTGTREAIDEVIAPRCVGRDPLRIVPLMNEMQHKLHVFGRAGPLAHGLSAVDIALWDIAGEGRRRACPSAPGRIRAGRSALLRKFGRLRLRLRRPRSRTRRGPAGGGCGLRRGQAARERFPGAQRRLATRQGPMWP
ncbi:hypothetical protein [Streptomyces fagopyri]|uniref:hypothetical protein n=1 Tax=Streptomyces fagopyri TaxID=2662397 RepID=UPI00340CA50B